MTPSPDRLCAVCCSSDILACIGIEHVKGRAGDRPSTCPSDRTYALSVRSRSRLTAPLEQEQLLDLCRRGSTSNTRIAALESVRSSLLCCVHWQADDTRNCSSREGLRGCAGGRSFGSTPIQPCSRSIIALHRCPPPQGQSETTIPNLQTAGNRAVSRRVVLMPSMS